MQREKSRHDRSDKMEMNPHYLAEERATAAATASLLGKGVISSQRSSRRSGQRGKKGKHALFSCRAVSLAMRRLGISEVLKDLRLPSAHLPDLPPSCCGEKDLGPVSQIILALGALSGSQFSSGSTHILQKQECAWAVRRNGGDGVNASAPLSVGLELVAMVRNRMCCHGQPRQPP